LNSLKELSLSAESKRIRVTSFAFREKMEKFTPVSVREAPRGRAFPVSTTRSITKL
jgi:hypothetical protein